MKVERSFATCQSCAQPSTAWGWVVLRCMRTSANWINDYLSAPATAEVQATLFTSVGFPCESSQKLPGGDFVQEVETTSNRGDCLSHLGLAREIAAASDRTMRMPTINAPRCGSAATTVISVSNHEPLRCSRYTARVVQGIRVAPSPPWLQERLRAIGQVPRNNVVDCTNFVLFEYGQPTHVFDLATLQGGAIQVRSAVAGEEFLPIGEGAQPVKLAGGELVIADASRPIALAGVKGGAQTAISDKTTDVVIEAAAFDPSAVRLTSRSLRISSDSSFRFERGVHPAEVDEAAERLVSLILETAGGRALAGSATAGPPLPPIARVSLRLERLEAIAGFTIPTTEVLQILSALGFEPKRIGAQIDCTVPPRRMDVTREIDLIEEVVRLAGFDRIPMVDRVSIRPVDSQPAVGAVRHAKNCLVGLGFVEVVSPTLVSQRAAAPFLDAPFTALRIEDERAVGEPILRPSLLATLLQTLKLNQDRGTRALRLFEHAAAFWLGPEGHHEERMIALLVAEPGDAETLYRLCRGSVERLGREICGRHAAISIAPSVAADTNARASQALDPVGCIRVDSIVVGVIGLINAKTLASAGLEGPIAAAELNWERLASSYPPTPRAPQLLNSPLLDRDLSLTVAESVPWAQVEATVREAALPDLESISFLGTFRGKQTGADRKSVTLRLTFRAADRTLKREEVEPHIARLNALFTSRLSAEIRT